MKYMLDTHSLLWTHFSPRKLSPLARREIQNPDNDVAVSVVAFWEISLKYALGKLELTGVKPEDLPLATEQAGIQIIPLDIHEAATFYQLPKLAHKDPFDRLVIWQTIQRKMVLITADRKFRRYQKYGLKLHW